MNTAYLNSVGIAPIRRVWNAASDLQLEGNPLTLQRIADRAGLKSKANVSYHLQNLRDAGMVDWEAGKRASFRILIPLYTMTIQQAETVAQWEAKHPAKEESLAAKGAANAVSGPHL